MKKPTHFGRRPILMQKWNGNLRIIYPNGLVEYDSSTYLGRAVFAKGYTSSKTQEEAYNNCIAEDDETKTIPDGRCYTAFLGYL